jgi:hypothetical protein
MPLYAVADVGCMHKTFIYIAERAAVYPKVARRNQVFKICFIESRKPVPVSIPMPGDERGMAGAPLRKIVEIA